MCVGGLDPLCSLCLVRGPMISTEIISNLQHPLLTESPTIIRLSASHCGVYPVKQFLSNLYVLFLAGKCCHIQRPGFSYQISSMSPPENSSYTLYSPLSNTKHEYKILHFKLAHDPDTSQTFEVIEVSNIYFDDFYLFRLTVMIRSS